VKVNNQVYENIVKLTKNTRDSFKSRGIILPTIDDDGNVNVGKFIIKRNNDGQFQIADRLGQTFYKNINLPQTAILVANCLATKKRVDNKVLHHDQRYGTKMFDDLNYTRLSKIYLKQRKFRQSVNMSIQSDYAADQANRARDIVLKTYKKLFELR
jgi:hypothetical protein